MPNSFSLKRLQSEQSQELQDLISLYNLVFETNYTHNLSTAYLQNLLDNPSIIFIVACINFDIVGGLTAYILPSAHYEGSEIYLYDLAVKSQYQRQKIGTSLIEFLKEYCRKNINTDVVFVLADLEDSHAIEFYKKNGGILEEVINFDFKIKK